ncbi:MAG: spore coat protein CotJB [Erysipelotrichaceae bacterium]|nr:spore coat protein CotJB [Erysipelotrichaceae bacterium]
MNYYQNKQDVTCFKRNESCLPIGNNFPLFNPETGFMLGNLFEGLYSPYKGFTNFKLNPCNEKEALHQQMLAFKFAAHELNLFLDMHPDNQNMLSLFHQYNTIYKQLEDKFVSLYHPITVNQVNQHSNEWVWINSPWPWENQ